jgi:bifunctional UDP-N-acetylglucosamine pyrophosphorylase/glucosamine-1-phosphate N-acetyltransferase
MEKVKIIILAGGKGTRMDSELPKVLLPLHGKPMIKHLLEEVKKSGICKRPVVVIGQERELVMKELGEEYDYVVQEEQLGTGHALLVTKPFLEHKTENIMVLNGDMPFIKADSIKKILKSHLMEKNDMTMGTVRLPDFKDWRKAFYSFGRIARDENGIPKGIIYGKNLSPEELEILEVDPAMFCFKAEWLWPRLNKLGNDNSHGEYYLTDLVSMTFNEGNPPNMISISPKEALGANSKQELEILESLAV